MPRQCELFGAFGWGVQCFLAVSCFGSLVYKRFRERPQRPWKIFLMDVSKQAITAGLAHIMNVLIALVLSAWETDNDPCVWYFINITIDTTLGVLLCYGLLQLILHGSTKQGWTRMQTGRYVSEEGGKLDFGAWGLQLTVWCMIVATVKVSLAAVIYLSSAVLGLVGSVLLGWLEPYPQAELVFVMVLVPLVMNCMQFWVQDTFLKDKAQQAKSIALVDISEMSESELLAS